MLCQKYRTPVMLQEGGCMLLIARTSRMACWNSSKSMHQCVLEWGLCFRRRSAAQGAQPHLARLPRCDTSGRQPLSGAILCTRHTAVCMALRGTSARLAHTTRLTVWSSALCSHPEQWFSATPGYSSAGCHSDSWARKDNCLTHPHCSR